MNNAALDKAYIAFNREETFAGGIAAAIETYNREAVSFVCEAVASEPQRDYRKELWIAFTAAVAGTERAVKAFDKFFKENP